MRLNLQPIIHVPGARLPFDFSMDLSEVELYGTCPLPEPLTVRGFVRNQADVLFLHGEVTAELALCCDRCRKAYRKTKTLSLDYMLAQELSGDEVEDILLLDGDELDLQELVYDAFLLDMDTKNLCSEDCRGLCSGCGANLNEEACRCRREIDPRWAALSQLLDKTE